MTYPYHPQCGLKVVVYRRCKRGGQDMYDALDVNGGSTGIPVWMTEAHWKELRITSNPKVPLETLQRLRALLRSQDSGLNRKENSYGGQNDDGKEATSATATTEIAQAAGESGSAGGDYTAACRVTAASTFK